jgi:hypothetical protein
MTPAQLIDEVSDAAVEAGPDARRTVVLIAPDGTRYEASHVLLHGPVLGHMRVAVTLVPFRGRDPQ